MPLHYTKLAHQISFENINLKVDPHTGGSVVIFVPKHREENQLLNMEYPLLFIFS